MRIRLRDFFETLTSELETYHPNQDWKTMEACIPLLDGMGLIGVVYYKPHEGQQEMGIVIRKEYHGRGIGKKAIKDIAKLAKENGETELIAKVFTKNKPMVHLLKKLRWKITDEFDEYIMLKKTL